MEYWMSERCCIGIPPFVVYSRPVLQQGNYTPGCIFDLVRSTSPLGKRILGRRISQKMRKSKNPIFCTGSVQNFVMGDTLFLRTLQTAGI